MSTRSINPRWMGTLLVAALATMTGAQPDPSLDGWPALRKRHQIDYESALNATPSAARARAWHDLFCTEPHVAGTLADRRTIRRLASSFEQLGLEVEVQEIHPLLSYPLEAQVQIISDGGPIDLPVIEQSLEDDSLSDHPTLAHGWNAYSASGDVTAEVVYANHGTKEDFELLAERGIDVTGRIVIARYGGNYRGYKAKFAEQAGAAGLIIYTDPADSGYARGLTWPEGGYANDSYIQRGSILTLDYPGDPLTPFTPATEDASRLDPDDVALPRIPVQPVGYDAARRIMERMRGESVHAHGLNRWQGGLPFTYRLTGGPELKVRVKVEQQRRIAATANVIGILPGEKWPDQKIVIGCHFDAWGWGASDPHAGSIVLYEIARSFAEAANDGMRPARTIVFANWAAEEYGIIGSTEWVEAHADDLAQNAVAYINLDMAAMGPDFGSSSAPTLGHIIADAARHVPQARAPGRTVFDHWAKDEDPSFGTLGGGSDHVGFYCHLGVPSCSLGAGGSQGVSYHSNYDHLAWYRRIVGDDYEPAVMLARIGNIVAARLACSPLLPLDPRRYADDTRRHLDDLEKLAAEQAVTASFSGLRAAIDAFEGAADRTMSRLYEAVQFERITPAQLDEVNVILLGLERAWIEPEGLAGRPWWRSLHAATDPDSGYASWPLPNLRHALEKPAAGGLGVGGALDQLTAVFEKLRARMEAIDRAITGSPAAAPLEAAAPPGRPGGDSP